MSIFDMSVEERLWFYVGMVYSGNGLWIWYFSEKGELYYTTCPYEKELQTFLFSGDCMEYASERKEKEQRPFLMMDMAGMSWIGEYVPTEREKRLFLVGPVFQANSSVQSLEASVRKMNLSVQMFRNCMKILQEVPVLNGKMFVSYAKMLHYLITLEDARYIEIKFNIKRKKEQNGQENEESVDYERMKNQEQMLLQYVRDGNRNYKEAMEKINAAGSDRLATGEPLQDAKSILIIFISKCAEAATEGGLPAKTAMEMERNYLMEAGRKKTIPELMELNVRMLEDFIGKVHESQQNYGVSKPINECCNYVKQHLTESLTLEKIAKEVGYTEYYLTRKFQKEMGMKLSDYIRERRMEYAKIWLTTTTKSIEEISEELHLGTRSYFGRTFKAATGMTPAAYRERVLGRYPEKKEEETK